MNILGGILTAIVLVVLRIAYDAWKYRKISRLNGIYHVFIQSQVEPIFWVRLMVNNANIELVGGRDINNTKDITIEGLITIQSSSATTGVGYYIDSFSNTESPSYIGNGKFYLKIIDKDTIRASADYFTNVTHNGITSTVMVKADEIWRKK